MINVFIVDDHQIFRDGLRLLIDSAEDITLIGEAESGASALAQLKQLQPDLILMDIQMPNENGIDITFQVKRLYPQTHVLMLTMFEDEQSVFAALQAGACGYILKGIKHGDLLSAMRVAAGGGAIFSPRIAARIMTYFGNLHSASAAPSPTVQLPRGLSQRERDVLQLLAQGEDNNTIADRLTVTPKTVRNYVSQVLKKLEVRDRFEAAALAQRAGLA